MGMPQPEQRPRSHRQAAPATSRHDPSKHDGEPLPIESRSYFEPRFGRDFSDVRIHRDARAAEAASRLRARAFTVGSSIAFGKRQYEPGTRAGQKLLAHELAHVAYHGRSGALFRKSEVEPHYPTPDEQRLIEVALSRGKSEKADSGASQDGESLDDEQRRTLASELYAPFWKAMDALPEGSDPSRALSEQAGLDVVEQAHTKVLEKFGKYTPRRLTSTRDTTTADQRKKANQILITVGPGSEADAALAYTVITTHCAVCRNKLAGLDQESSAAVKALIVARAKEERGEELRRAAVDHVAGQHGGGDARINVGLRDEDSMLRYAAHEWLHAYTHPAFNAAFNDERNILDGFTEYFTLQVAPLKPDYTSGYAAAVAQVGKVRAIMSGPFLFISGAAAEESLRLAYFAGRLDLVGWRPKGDAERKAVEKAGGAPEWDPAKGKEYAERYRAEAVALQAASPNLLGVGIFFSWPTKEPTIAVRYARVLAQTSPYAQGRLLYEGQLMGSSEGSPSTWGASVGLAGEYQHPYFYVGGGLRVVGTAALGPAPAPGGEPRGRVDFSPFAGIGARWRWIRVGVEGAVLFPVTGQAIKGSVGGVVNVEF